MTRGAKSVNICYTRKQLFISSAPECTRNYPEHEEEQNLREKIYKISKRTWSTVRYFRNFLAKFCSSTARNKYVRLFCVEFWVRSEEGVFMA